MAAFQYEAINTKNGKTENGELLAASQAEALARLQEMNSAPKPRPARVMLKVCSLIQRMSGHIHWAADGGLCPSSRWENAGWGGVERMDERCRNEQRKG